MKPAPKTSSSGAPTRIVYGINPIKELLCYPERVVRLLYQDGPVRGVMAELLDIAISHGVDIEAVGRNVLDKLSQDGVHQGIMARAKAFPFMPFPDMLDLPPRSVSGRRLILACDQITDPHNFGSMVRSLEAMGGTGVIITTRRSVQVTAVVSKTSAGAIEHIPVANVVNLNRALDTLKDDGWKILGLDMDGTRSVFDVPTETDRVVVVGSEGRGLRPQTLERCDEIVSIPMTGKVESLNASVSVGITVSTWLGKK